ncbi:M1 family aminopeptidase [Aestuariibaculum sp. YM273]|uniref:M1 family metallopeptidase n=1 Tax=Aestuariibaculum sp. YM273 TaxID=3070659 RepID=UPI0027DD4CAB|nr:M1 family aminopeptidase [Aestuariibaculum sp. YM273]WMI64186.1 M1 family aminopeptidase [Aestuariibaculum sp. YM273]
MRNLFLVLMLVCVVSCNTKPSEENQLLVEGISSELATYRKKQVSDIVYNLTFNIPLEREKAIASNLNLSLQVNDLEHPLYLDFNEDKSHLKSVAVNGENIKINHQREHLIIPQDYLKKGHNQVSVAFDAGEVSLNRNDDYLYTLLVPDRASTLFPCFDQPDLKANYKLEITAPSTWKVLCGGPLEFEETVNNYTKHVYGLTDKMSTYLFSFVAGGFNETSQKPADMEMTLLYRENDSAKIAASVDAIFEHHQKAVDFLEEYTQYPFPFQKMDYATIPGFQYGGMEHVGAIQYKESSLFLDGTTTQERLLNRARLIAHETAHMWFGDLVTMKWFDDVWLKEVFANFMADKTVNGSFPNINHDLKFLTSHYPRAYSEDRTQGATPIRQNLRNLKNAGTLYGNIIYHKAPIMMRQLEVIMGEEPFRKGMRNYIKTYANGNATWNDLVELLDNETPIDLKQWSEVWVNKSGRPVISDSIVYDANGKIERFEVMQHAEDGTENIWTQAFNIGLVYKDSVHLKTVNLDAKQISLTTLVGMPKPEAVVYNYNGLGYGVFPTDFSNHHIYNIKDDVARGFAYINLYENMLSGNVAAMSAFNEMLDGLKVEKEDLIINLISGEIKSIFWKYFTADERDLMLESLESFLQERLKENLDPSIKKTVFNLYKSVAYSETGKDFLYQVWNRSIQLDNVYLNENDYTGIASALAIFKHEQADDILKTAHKQITNADRKKNFEFILPALSNDENVRDAFMKSLAKPENREKESWVLDALDCIHHPLRQQSGQKHLRLCLDLLEEIQLTGDIFFPKAWLSGTIGEYTSPEAYKVLQEFLAENPNYSPVLKNKLLQATDPLYRVQNLWKN